MRSLISYFKDYEILKATGYEIEGVMEFRTVGFWSGMNFIMEPARKFLRWMLVTIHNFVPNYGVAIILLTLIVRGLFWPLTHKSTESMKRMSELQPKIKALQEKYKETPQVMQETISRLPAAFCLDKIPRAYILRALIAFSMEPKKPIYFRMTLVGSLNILPLLTGTTVLQQHLTRQPQITDDDDFMPIVMLFISTVCRQV